MLQPYQDMSDIEAILEGISIPSDLRHLIPGFIERRQLDVLTLKNLLATQNYEELKRLGHRLKGHGRGYGFGPITDCGLLIEELSRNRNLDGLSEIIERFETYIDLISKNIHRL